MKITIPRVVTPVSLANYAPELDGKNLYVWVNPPKDKLQAYNETVLSLQAQDVEEARQTLFPAESSSEKKEESALLKAYGLVSRFLSLKKERKPEGLDQKLLDWYAEIWSQGPQDSHWTVDELRVVESQDPAFLSWMIAQTWNVRSEHIERKKKA